MKNNIVLLIRKVWQKEKRLCLVFAMTRLIYFSTHVGRIFEKNLVNNENEEWSHGIDVPRSIGVWA